MNATGHWYTTQYKGRHFLVTPLGNLYFGAGVNNVNYQSQALINTPRRFSYYEELPPVNVTSDGSTNWKGSSPNYGYEFYNQNIQTIYGGAGTKSSIYLPKFYNSTNARLDSWGFNLATISDVGFVKTKRRPYVVLRNVGGWSTGVGAALLSGPNPFFVCNTQYNMPDVWDPIYVNKSSFIISSAANDTSFFNNSYVMGMYIDNEVPWTCGLPGTSYALARSILLLNNTFYAKRAYNSFLYDRYDGNITTLNTAWGTNFTDWNTFNSSALTPGNTTSGLADLSLLVQLYAEQYFRVNRDSIKKWSPNSLYFGCRFTHPALTSRQTIEWFRAADKFLDVISINIYKQVVFKDDVSPVMTETTKPWIISEFSFSMLYNETGVFGPVVNSPLASNQGVRGDAYKGFLESVFNTPNVVSTNWYTFVNCPVTGINLNGENVNVGIVDVANVPYGTFLQEVAQVNRNLYSTLDSIWSLTFTNTSTTSDNSSTSTSTSSSTSTTVDSVNSGQIVSKNVLLVVFILAALMFLNLKIQ